MTKSILFALALFFLASCASFDRYLAEHRAKQASQVFFYTQIGRVECYGPFDLAILQTNQAWPASPEDTKLMQASFAVVVAQPIAVNGTLIYPALPQPLRIIRIAHHVRGYDDREPFPTWTGPVIHERTEVPWIGDDTNRYDQQQHRYERSYEKKTEN